MSYEFIFQIWRRYHEKWDFSETIYELIHSKVNTFTECLMSTYRIWEPAVGNERPLLLHTNHFPHVIKAGVIRHQVVERRLVFFYNSWRITVDENNESLNVHLENSLIYIVLKSCKQLNISEQSPVSWPLLMVLRAISHSTSPKAQMSTLL